MSYLPKPAPLQNHPTPPSIDKEWRALAARISKSLGCRLLEAKQAPFNLEGSGTCPAVEAFTGDDAKAENVETVSTLDAVEQRLERILKLTNLQDEAAIAELKQLFDAALVDRHVREHLGTRCLLGMIKSATDLPEGYRDLYRKYA